MKIKFIDVPPEPASWEPWVKEVLLMVKEVSVVEESREGYTVLFGDLVVAVGKVSPATTEWLRTWKKNQPGSTIVFPREFCEIVPWPAAQTRSDFGTQGGGGRSG